MWRPEENLLLPWGSQVPKSVIKFGSKYLYLLGHPTPRYKAFLKWKTVGQGNRRMVTEVGRRAGDGTAE